MRNKYITGTKNPKLNDEIIEKCQLPTYSSKYKILEHFYHTDTYIDDNRVRLQGYVYPEDLYDDNYISEINIPDSVVSYMDGKLILYFSSISHEIK